MRSVPAAMISSFKSPTRSGALGAVILHTVSKASRFYLRREQSVHVGTSMGAVPSRLKRASRRYLKGRGPKRLTREQQHMIKQYLPDFKYYEPATDLHRQIASSHWESVFRRSSRFSDSSTVTSHSSRSSHASIECRIRQLFDAFYIYLDHNAPHLKHVFRASLHVRSKVLVHISAGIRFLLTSEKMEEKMTELTKTHARFGVEKEFYNPLGNALIHAMKETSDGIWSNEIEDAWRRLFTHCSAVLLVYHGQAAERKIESFVRSLLARGSSKSTRNINSSTRKLPIPEQ